MAIFPSDVALHQLRHVQGAGQAVIVPLKCFISLHFEVSLQGKELFLVHCTTNRLTGRGAPP
jgi:hypothetical protein